MCDGMAGDGVLLRSVHVMPEAIGAPESSGSPLRDAGRHAHERSANEVPRPPAIATPNPSNTVLGHSFESEGIVTGTPSATPRQGASGTPGATPRLGADGISTSITPRPSIPSTTPRLGADGLSTSLTPRPSMHGDLGALRLPEEDPPVPLRLRPLSLPSGPTAPAAPVSTVEWATSDLYLV